MAANIPGMGNAVPSVLYGTNMTKPVPGISTRRPADPEKEISLTDLLELEFKRCPECQAKMTNELCEVCDHNDRVIENLKEAIVLLSADVEALKNVATQLVREHK
jgi:hypothetical protein